MSPQPKSEWESAASILEDARLLITKRGWQQGATEHVESLCLATSLEEAFLNSGRPITEFDYARDILLQQIGARTSFQAGDGSLPYWGAALAAWNDAPGRRRDEVLELLSKASEHAKRLASRS